MEAVRRLIAWILVLCLVIQNPVYTLADTGAAGGGSAGTYVPSVENPNFKASAAVFKTYGYKVTITHPKDKLADVSPLGETYTISDLEQQFSSMDASTGRTYYEPGARGIYAYATDPRTGGGRNFSVTSAVGLDSSAQVVNFKLGDGIWNEIGNPLAWALYEGETKAGSPFLYNEELAYLFTADGASACGDALSWINEVNRLYDTIQQNPDYKDKYTTYPVVGDSKLENRTPLNVVKGLFQDPDGSAVVAKFKHITWSTNVDALYGATGEDPYVKALSARLGLVGLDALLCLTALRAGDTKTLQEMAEKTYAWVASDYSFDNMAMIMVEVTSGVNTNGNTSGSVDFITLLDHMSLSFGTHEILCGNWPEDCYNSTEKALVWCTNGATIPDGWRGPFRQGMFGYPSGGTFVHDTSNYYADRKYFRLLYPTGSGELFGYFVNWAYDAVCGPSSSGSKNTMGSFTWKLNPDGVNDKTPAEEVNASSTIYDLNIAQDGYNANNYMTDWVPTVRQDNATCNKLRIRIYHVSENLTEDQQATEYARDAVKKQGKPVTEAITKVTPGDGVISG